MTNVFRFRIPKDHPRADELLNLSRLLATSYRADSIEVHRAGVVPPSVAEAEILGLLRTIVGRDVVDEAVGRVRAAGNEFSTTRLLRNLRVPGLTVSEGSHDD